MAIGGLYRTTREHEGEHEGGGLRGFYGCERELCEPARGLGQGYGPGGELEGSYEGE